MRRLLRRYPPSLLAAAIVLAARKAINIRPLWNAALEPVLGFGETSVAAPYTHVWENYATLFPEDARLAIKREKAAERKAVQLGIIAAPPGFVFDPPAPQPQPLASMLASPSGVVGGGTGGTGSAGSGMMATPATPLTVSSNPHEDASTSTSGGSGAGSAFSRSGGALSVHAASGGGGGGGGGTGGGGGAPLVAANDGRYLCFSGLGAGAGAGTSGSCEGASGGGGMMVLSPAPAVQPREAARASMGDELMMQALSPMGGIAR